MRACAAVLTFILMVAYWPGISGTATTPRWTVGALFALLGFFAPSIRFRAVHVIGLALVGWLLVTLLWSEGQQDGVDQAAKLLTIACAFAFGSTLANVRAVVIAARCGVAVSSALAVLDATGVGLSALPSYGAPAGLFYNPDRLAEVAALVAAAALGMRMWVWLPVLVPALVLPGERTSLLALGAVLGVMAWRVSNSAVRLIGGTLLLVAAAVAINWKVARGLDVGITERLALWRDTLPALNFFGHGLGSFWESFPHYAQAFDLTKSRPEHPHNEWLWLGFEGGVPALALGVAFAVALVRACRDRIAGRIVIVALFVESLFAMPFHDPATGIFGALLAGHFAGGFEPVGVASRRSRLSLRAWFRWPRHGFGNG